MTPREAIEYLGSLPEDEPVFVLRARDQSAAASIAGWRAVLADTISRLGADFDTTEARAKIRESFDCEAAMRAWPVKQVAGVDATRREE